MGAPTLVHKHRVVLFIYILFLLESVDTEMCCPKGKYGCQYFILLTLKKNNTWT